MQIYFVTIFELLFYYYYTKKSVLFIFLKKQ